MCMHMLMHLTIKPNVVAVSFDRNYNSRAHKASILVQVTNK